MNLLVRTSHIVTFLRYFELFSSTKVTRNWDRSCIWRDERLRRLSVYRIYPNKRRGTYLIFRDSFMITRAKISPVRATGERRLFEGGAYLLFQ